MKCLRRIGCWLRGHKYKVSVHRGKKYRNPWCDRCGKPWEKRR